MVDGYGVKYRAHFGSAFGGRFELRILQRDYVGASDLLLFEGQEAGAGFVHPTNQPLNISWGRKGSDVYTPVLASHASAKFWKVGGTTLLDDLRGAPNGKFLMEVFYDPAYDFGGAGQSPERFRYWVGRVKTDTYSDSTITAPSQITVEAADGLGVLKKIPFEQVTETTGFDPRTGTVIGTSEITMPYEGRVRMIEHMARCFARLPYALPIESFVDWNPWQAGYNASFDPVQELYVGSEAFHDDEGDPMMCHKVLKQTGYTFGAQIYQSRGRWCITGRETLMNTGGGTVHVYTPNGAPDGTRDATGPFDFDPQNGHRRLAGDRSYRESRGSASVFYNYGSIPSLIDNGGFEQVDLDATGTGRSTILVWQMTAGYAGKNLYPLKVPGAHWWARTEGPSGEMKIDYGLGIDSFFYDDSNSSPFAKRDKIRENGANAKQSLRTTVPEGAILSFGAKFSIGHREGDGNGLFQPYWVLKVGDYILNPTEPDTDGVYQSCEWQLATERANWLNFVVAPGDRAGDTGVPLKTKNDFTFVTPPHPTGGTGFVQLYGTADRPGQRLDPFFTVWNDVQLSIADTEGEVLSGTKTVASTGGEGEKDEVEVFLGEGPTETHPNRLTWGEEGPMATDWKRTPYSFGDDPTGKTLGSLIAESYVRAQTEPLETRQEKYYRLVDEAGLYEMGRALRLPDAPQIDGTTGIGVYHPAHLSKDLYTGTDDAEFVRLIFPGLDFTTTTEAQEGGFDAGSDGGTRGITTEGGASGASARELRRLAGYVSRKNAIAETSAEVEGDVAELPVVPVDGGGVLKSGDGIVVIDAATGRPVHMQIVEDEADGADVLHVESPTDPGAPVPAEIIAEGSGIYYASRSSLYAIRALQQEQEINSSVIRTLLTGDYDASTAKWVYDASKALFALDADPSARPNNPRN